MQKESCFVCRESDRSSFDKIFLWIMQASALLLHEGCGEVAVPWRLYGGPFRPVGERSWRVFWRFAPNGGLAKARLDVRVNEPWCWIIAPLVLLSTVTPVCARVFITVGHEVLCGSGVAVSGQTHIAFAEKSEIYRRRRCRVIWRGFCVHLFILDTHWLGGWLRRLSDKKQCCLVFNQMP